MLEMVLGATVVLVLARFAWLEEDKRGWGILKRTSKNQMGLTLDRSANGGLIFCSRNGNWKEKNWRTKNKIEKSFR